MEQLIFPVTKREAEKTGQTFSSETNKNAVFPSLLRKLREEKGVSQERLSKVLGVSKSTVGLWETGDTLPDAKSIFDLANYYYVSADYLLGRSKIRTYNAHWRAVCELTGLSDEAAKLIINLSAPRENDPNGHLKNALNAFLSNKKFVSLIMELKTCIVESGKLGAELEHLSSYRDEEFPDDIMELLEYAKGKWGYVWASGERYRGFGAGVDVVNAEEKRGYTLFVLQNIFMEIVKEISESEIRGEKI